jgi:uncharacterized protein (TIGR02271 family)
MNPDDVPVAEDSPKTREIVVPLYAEEVSVSKRVVRESRVQVSRVTHEQEQLVDELLAREHVEIDRVPIGQAVDTMPAVREEDGTIIVPVVEEVLTIERHLILKEEVRIRRVRDVERHQESVAVRKQEAIITRLPIEDAAVAKAAAVGLIGPEKEE